MKNEANCQRREQLLDEALKATFPASDPLSIAMPQRLKKGGTDDGTSELA
jgi:hypothetical protein